MELRRQMQLIFVEHRGHYGYRWVTMELRHQGMVVTKKRRRGWCAKTIC
jgi:hypothetical protein